MYQYELVYDRICICVCNVYFPHLASLHLPDGRFDLPHRLELEAGLQRPAALVVPLQCGLRSRALRLPVTLHSVASEPQR